MPFGYKPPSDRTTVASLFGSNKKNILFDKNKHPSSRTNKAKASLLGLKNNRTPSPLTLKSRKLNRGRRVDDTPSLSDIREQIDEEAFGSDGEEHQSDPDSDEENDWYDGRALIESLNIGIGDEKFDEPSRKLSVVQELKDAFDAHGGSLRSELTEPIVEALNQISHVHAIVEGTADEDFRRGLQTFFDGSCTARDLRIKARKHLTDSLDENQATIKTLFERLKRAYDKRAALWTELDSSLNQCAENATASLADMDASIKRTDTFMDKRCRVLNHEAESKGSRGVLKTLLGHI